MDKILELARGFLRDNRTHFSFVLRKNKIVSIGEEKRHKTHTLADELGYKYPTIHSELDAYTKIPKNNRDGLVLVNTRVSPTGRLGMSRPCVYCMGWVVEVFDEIYFTNQDGILEKL